MQWLKTITNNFTQWLKNIWSKVIVVINSMTFSHYLPENIQILVIISVQKLWYKRNKDHVGLYILCRKCHIFIGNYNKSCVFNLPCVQYLLWVQRTLALLKFDGVHISQPTMLSKFHLIPASTSKPGPNTLSITSIVLFYEQTTIFLTKIFL